MRRCSFASLSSCLLASLLMSACGSSDEGEDTSVGEESTSSTGTDTDTDTDTETETETETETGDPVCFPEGIYGPCKNMPCQCLVGGEWYQVCTTSCVDDSDCGDPADFPGAMPSCLPASPGATEMVCSLVCTSSADCPCGLTCGHSTPSICAQNTYD
jgi:hypothetical protein